MSSTKPKTIDEFLAGMNAEQRAVLEKLRRTIRAAAPGAEECISYGLAAFRLNGRPLMAFGAWKNHCALYPMSSTTAGMFRKELKEFETSKGTIRFTTDQPLPAVLVKKLVKARIAENAERVGRTKAKIRHVSRKVPAAPLRGALRSAGLRPAATSNRSINK